MIQIRDYIEWKQPEVRKKLVKRWKAFGLSFVSIKKIMGIVPGFDKRSVKK